MSEPSTLWWKLLGLATGLFLGSMIISMTTDANASALASKAVAQAGKDPIVANDADPHDGIHMTVEQVILTYDQALNRYGPERGIAWKEMLNAYLLGIETGLYEEASIKRHDFGEQPSFCLSNLMTGSQLVEFLRIKAQNIGFAQTPYQLALTRALRSAYPCPLQ
jgi:hypothetical protein